MSNVWVCYSGSCHAEELEEQLLHLQVRVLRHGNLSNVHRGNQSVHAVVHSGRLELEKSMTSSCQKVGSCSGVEFADLQWFVLEELPDMWLLLHLFEAH